MMMQTGGDKLPELIKENGRGKNERSNKGNLHAHPECLGRRKKHEFQPLQFFLGNEPDICLLTGKAENLLRKIHIHLDGEREIKPILHGKHDKPKELFRKGKRNEEDHQNDGKRNKNPLPELSQMLCERMVASDIPGPLRLLLICCKTR